MARIVTAWRPNGVTRTAWSTEVALAAGQRLIKAAGSYAFLGRTQGREEYLRWFAPALRRAFEQLADWAPAAELESSLKEAGVSW